MYLDQTFLLYVRKVVMQSSNVVKAKAQGFDAFFQCLGRSLQNINTPDEELRKCMKNDVLTRSDGHVMHVILSEVLNLVKQRIGPQASFSLTKLRKAIGQHEGTSIDHSGIFGGIQRRCVKISRNLVNKDMLELIDKAIGEDNTENTNTDHSNESENSKQNEEIDDLRKKLAAVEEHNKKIIDEKMKLEEALSVEKMKRAAAERRVLNIQCELSSKERKWKGKEDELNATIIQLQKKAEKAIDNHTAFQTSAASSFSQLMSSTETTYVSQGESIEQSSSLSGQDNLDDSGILVEEQETAETIIKHSGQRTKKKRTSEVVQLQDKLHKGIIDGKRQSKRTKQPNETTK